MAKKRGRGRDRDRDDDDGREEQGTTESWIDWMQEGVRGPKDNAATTSTRRRRFDDRPPPAPAFDDGPPGVAPGPPEEAPGPSRRRARPSRGKAVLEQYGDIDRRREDPQDPLPRRGPLGRGGRKRDRGGEGKGKGGRRTDTDFRGGRRTDVEDFLRDAPDVSDNDVQEAKGLWGNRRRRRGRRGVDEVEQAQRGRGLVDEIDEEFDQGRAGASEASDDGDGAFDPAEDDAESGLSDNHDVDARDGHRKQKSRRLLHAEHDPSGAVSWKVPMGDDELSDFVFSVHLEMVPIEYNHETLVELHETTELRNFQTSVVIDNPDNAPGCQTMMLRYADQESAEAACAQLHGQGVASGTGEVWDLAAKVTKKEVANPFCSVYISDLPTDFTDRMLVEMHRDCGLGPDDAPATIKRLTSSYPADETICCIARYKNSTAADAAIQALHGLPVTTKSGSHKTLSARRAKPAKWQVGFGGAGAYTSGAYSADGLGADHHGGGKGSNAQAARATYGQGGDGKGGKSHIYSREFLEMEAERNAQPVECGVSLFGKVKLWNEERGFGMVLVENGGPDIFVHRSALCDGRFLEPDSDVTFEVRFDEAKGKYRASMLHGAMGPDPRQEAMPRPPPPPDTPPPPPPVSHFAAKPIPPLRKAISPELRGFVNYWGLDHNTANSLASFDPDFQMRVLSEFNPSFADGGANINVKVRHFVTSMRARLESGVVENTPSPGIVREWNEEGNCGFVEHTDGKPGAPHIYVHQSALTDGSHLVVGAEIVFEAEWDALRGMHIASTCTGAEGEVPEPLELSDELATFSSQFNFNRPTLVYLLDLPSDVLSRVISGFPATVESADEAANHNTAVRAFTVSMRAKAQVQIPTGVMLNGKCEQWMEGKGYGFVVADSGGGKIFVHCTKIVDGGYLVEGAEVKFEVAWQEDRRRYSVVKCEGGVPKEEIKVEVSAELEAFGQMWAVDEETIQFLATMPEAVQSKLVKNFQPYRSDADKVGDTDGGHMHARIRGYARSLQQNQRVFVPEPEAPAEVSEPLSYFGQLWEVDQETLEWIARLPKEVQTAVTEEFMGTYSDETLMPQHDGETVQEPRDALFISGLPHTFNGSPLSQWGLKEQLTKLFSQFGQVVHAKTMLSKRNSGSTNAIVRMADAKQAKMAVEDLHRKVPHGFPHPILVRFFVDNPPTAATSVDELKCGEWLTGKISAWYADRGFGFIQPTGGGPDVFCFGSAKGAASAPLEKGVICSFEADWNEERQQYFTTKVAVTSAGSGAAAEETACSSRVVRAFARTVHARLTPKTVGVLGPLKVGTAWNPKPFVKKEDGKPPPERNPLLPAPGGGISLWQTPAAKDAAKVAIAKLFQQGRAAAPAAAVPVGPTNPSLAFRPQPVILLRPGQAIKQEGQPAEEPWAEEAPADAELAFGLPGNGFT